MPTLAAMRVVRHEDVDVAVVVEVGGQDGLAEAADVQGGDARILGKPAAGAADVQDGLGRWIVGSGVDIGEDVGHAVAGEVGESGVAILAAGGDQTGEPLGRQWIVFEGAVAASPSSHQIEATVAVDVPEGGRHRAWPVGVVDHGNDGDTAIGPPVPLTGPCTGKTRA